ncbi:FAD-dependent oxidoreductase [Rhodococcoides fascians A21d2]|uniref:NAD(P)/FAD-dependent oxidoreductase n=1 Tax=Rhodococcoides fascians TaxID=1828 RepID=UPI000A9D64EE|nr:FAD-dependent oxidoreductase [Rhodococcus fascians]QII00274.1 FAD-dependent oxidoreductase [Rhodococcus fascians A21d2]
MSEHVVVVGASLSGIKAARELRALGFDGAITMIGEEEALPYDRPPLSKEFLAGERELNDFSLTDAAELRALDVEFIGADPATALDEESNTVTLSSGRVVGYDQVIMATGACPNRPPWFRPMAGLHLLRSIEDAFAIRDQLPTARRVVIVGGGFIGTEAAAKLVTMVKDVTLVTDGNSVLEPLGRELAARFTALHRIRGVAVLTNSFVVDILGNDRVRGVQLVDDSIVETDLVLVAVGARPNSAWVPQLADPLTGAVAVRADGKVRGNVWAAGDVTSAGAGHWFSAVRQSKRVARAILGIEDKSTARLDSEVPYMWTDQFELKVQLLGSVRQTDDFHVLDQENATEPSNFVGVYSRDGIISGGVLVDQPQVLGKMRQIVASRGTINDAVKLLGAGVRS